MDIAPQHDADPSETEAWIESFAEVIRSGGEDRGRLLLSRLVEYGQRHGIVTPFTANTPYVNTIPLEDQPVYPGDRDIERRIKNQLRWNAMAMVVRANKDTNVGGHIASFASAAMLYDIGYNHFWHAPSKEHGGDLVLVQGHSATGVYARAFMLGRFTPEQIEAICAVGEQAAYFGKPDAIRHCGQPVFDCKLCDLSALAERTPG
jgi:pyruvate dehydrogenase E1 component